MQTWKTWKNKKTMFLTFWFGSVLILFIAIAAAILVIEAWRYFGGSAVAFVLISLVMAAVMTGLEVGAENERKRNAEQNEKRRRSEVDPLDRCNL